MPSSLHYRRVWLGAGWAFVALVVYLSLTPDPLPAGDAFGLDLGHAAAYAWLMFWFAQLLPSPRARLACGVALCALGALLEILQGTTGYREFSYADMRDDALGVALGAWLATTVLAAILPRVDAALAALARRF